MKTFRLGSDQSQQRRMALLLSVLCLSFTCLACDVEQRSTYIVHMAKSEMLSDFSHCGAGTACPSSRYQNQPRSYIHTTPFFMVTQPVQPKLKPRLWILSLV